MDFWSFFCEGKKAAAIIVSHTNLEPPLPEKGKGNTYPFLAPHPTLRKIPIHGETIWGCKTAFWAAEQLDFEWLEEVP